MLKWPKHYQGRVFSDTYAAYFEKQYAPFLDAIQSHVKVGDRIVEIGCGMASTTRALKARRMGFLGFHCYDINHYMLALARANLIEYPTPCDLGNAWRALTCKPDIIHSHGLLEHFSNDEIMATIQANDDSGARAAIHYVPGEGHITPSFGDERLMPLDFWTSTFLPDKAETFNDGKDYILTWEF